MNKKNIKNSIQWTLIVTLLLAILYGCGGDSSPTEPQNLSLSGIWSGTASDSSGAGTFIWRLTQTDNNISGSVTIITPLGSVACNGTISGTLSDATLTFTMDISNCSAPYSGCSITASGTATVINDTTIDGTYSGFNSCTGSFTDGQFLLKRQ